MRLSSIMWVGPKCNDKCLYKRQKRGYTEERPCQDRDKAWNYVVTSQGIPGAIRSWKRQERIFSQSLKREHGSEDTFGPLAARTMKEQISIVLSYQLVVIWYGSHKKPIHMAISCCKEAVECVSGLAMCLLKTQVFCYLKEEESGY